MLSHIFHFVSKDDGWNNYIKIMGSRLRNNNIVNRQCSAFEGGSWNLLREKQFNTIKRKYQVWEIIDENQLCNDRAPCLFITLSYVRLPRNYLITETIWA